MEKEETRLQALRVLNEHFKYEGKLGWLEDRQVKLVLDAMIEFYQFGVIKSVCPKCYGLGEIQITTDNRFTCTKCCGTGQTAL